MTDPQPRLLERHRWLAYVLPLAVYMVVSRLEPSPPRAMSEFESRDGATVEREQR